MDLVGHHDDAVVEADFGEPQQLRPGPDAAHGVVGAAQQKQFHPGLGAHLFKQVEVDVVGPLSLDEGAEKRLPPLLLGAKAEGVIDGAQHEHPVPGVRQGLHDLVEGGHDAGAGDEPFLLGPKPVAALHPALDRFEIPRRGAGVAQHVVIQVLLEPRHHLGRV